MSPLLCATIDTFELVPQIKPDLPDWAQYIIFLNSFAATATCSVRESKEATVFPGCGAGALGLLPGFRV